MARKNKEVKDYKEERKKLRKKNRRISFLYIGVFCCALCLLGFVVTNIVQTYFENVRLEKLNNQIQEDVEILGTGVNGAKEGYFIVYAMGDYVAIEENGEIIIVYGI